MASGVDVLILTSVLPSSAFNAAEHLPVELDTLPNRSATPSSDPDEGPSQKPHRPGVAFGPSASSGRGATPSLVKRILSALGHVIDEGEELVKDLRELENLIEGKLPSFTNQKAFVSLAARREGTRSILTVYFKPRDVEGRLREVAREHGFESMASSDMFNFDAVRYCFRENIGAEARRDSPDSGLAFVSGASSVASSVEISAIGSNDGRGSDGAAALMTIGGVILVGNKMYGLTMGHGIHHTFQQQQQDEGQAGQEPTPVNPWKRKQPGRQWLLDKTQWRLIRGEPELEIDRKNVPRIQVVGGVVSARRYPTDGSEDDSGGHPADWALVELEDADLVGPNAIFRLQSSDELLWSAEGDRISTDKESNRRRAAVSRPAIGGHRPSDVEQRVDKGKQRATGDTEQGEEGSRPGGSEDGDEEEDVGLVKANLLQQVISEAELLAHAKSHSGRAPCLVVTSSGVVPGFVAEAMSTVLMDDTPFPVFRIDARQPFERGDSGSWVVVEDVVGHSTALGGVVVATIGPGVRDNAPRTVSGGYMIPIEHVFRSISKALGATVSLPTRLDWRIAHLRASHQKWLDALSSSSSSSSTSATARLPMLELLVAESRAERKARSAALAAVGDRKSLEFIGAGPLEQEQDSTRAARIGPILSTPLSPSPGVVSSWYLGVRDHIRPETISALLRLGELFPLSVEFRRLMSGWTSSYHTLRRNIRRAWTTDRRTLRRLRSHRPLTFATHFMLDQFLHTQAGENLVFALIFLRRGLKSQERQLEWLPMVLFLLLEAVAPSSASPTAPTLEQLETFVSCILAAFRDDGFDYLTIPRSYYSRELPHFDHVPGSRPEPGPPTDWSTVLLRAVESPAYERTSLSGPWLSLATGGGIDHMDFSGLEEGASPHRQDAWWDTASAAEASRLLLLMHRVASARSPGGGSSTEEILVVGGRGALAAGRYAALVLGLLVEARAHADSHGEVIVWQRIKVAIRLEQRHLVQVLEEIPREGPRLFDVLIFPQSEEAVCEIINRSEIV